MKRQLRSTRDAVAGDAPFKFERRKAASFPVVHSVVRALDLLSLLNSRPVSTVDDLHTKSGIPKPSIVRMLQTFVRYGLVSPDQRRGAYRLTSAVRRLAIGYHTEPKLIEAATPLLDALTRRIKWPLGIATFDTDAMVVQYSTIPNSPLSLLHSSVGMRLSLVSRAHGRAYLAFCDEPTQEALIRILQASDVAENLPARDEPTFRSLLAEVRDRGIATRHPRVRTVSNTLAVPVFERGQLAGTVGLTFIASAMRPKEAIERYSSDLRQLAGDISARLDQLMERDPAGT